MSFSRHFTKCEHDKLHYSFGIIVVFYNVLCHHFYLPQVIRPIRQVQNTNGVFNKLVPCLKCKELARSTGQASSMYLRHGTSLLSSPLPFWTQVLLSQVSKMISKNFASCNNLALVFVMKFSIFFSWKQRFACQEAIILFSITTYIVF